MGESMIYARTDAGNAELDKADSKVVGDAKRLMLLVDGKSSVDAIGKKVPPSVRKYMDGIFTRLLAERLIVESGKVDIVVAVKPHSRITSEQVKEAMLTSQKFSKDMLGLAEIEIERRLELEQDLAESQAKLSETTAHLNSVTARYHTLKEQVLLYKQGMEATIAAQQAQLTDLSGQSQASQTEKEQLEQAHKTMLGEFQHMQKTLRQNSDRMDETVRIRVLEQQHKGIEKRKQQKMSDDEMVQNHPNFQAIRNLDFFKKFRNSDLAQILVWAEWKDVKKGEVVVEEGQFDIVFYIVVSGRLAVLKGKKNIQIIREGEPFGEIAYQAGDEPKRSATVIARTDCSLLLFNPAYLESAELMVRVLVAEAFMGVQARRLRSTVEMVSNLLVDDED